MEKNVIENKVSCEQNYRICMCSSPACSNYCSVLLSDDMLAAVSCGCMRLCSIIIMLFKVIENHCRQQS